MIVSDEPVITMKMSQYQRLIDEPKEHGKMVVQLIDKLVKQSVECGKATQPDAEEFNIHLASFTLRVNYMMGLDKPEHIVYYINPKI